MNRITNFLFRNWPLKLGAILLATVLYAGLVLGQNVRTWTGTLPVDVIDLPTGVTLLSEPAPVTVIRYRASLDVGVLSPRSFNATVDLSDISVEADGPAVAVPITVIALDQRVQIVDFEPREVQIQVDPITEREMPVSVRYGTVPDSVTLGPEQIEPATVVVRGAASRVDAVAEVVARVSIDASALNIDRDIRLVAVDANGNEVPSVQVEPERVRVRIAVAQELATRTLPVVPQLVGAPAPGYRVTSVAVDPLVMTVNGESAIIEQLQSIPTSPIDISGRTDDLEAEVAVTLPPGATPSQADMVRVTLTIAEETSTQSFTVGIVLENESVDFGYVPSAQGVSVTLGGPTSALGAVDGAALVATADVGGLAPGVHVVPLRIEPLPGLSVVSTDPPSVSIVVSAPEVAPTPAESP